MVEMAGSTCGESDISFFKLGVLLEDRSKTIQFLQDCGVLPNDTRNDCIYCGKEKCVGLRKNSQPVIPCTLRCSKCHKGVSAAMNTWFERGKSDK